jgi:hypothetical protein
MKRIILFTKLKDDTEWTEWSKIADEKKIKIEDDNIELNDDINLVVIKGDKKLNNFTDDAGEIDNDTFKQFLYKLCNELKNHKVDEDTIVAIHFGGGRPFEEMVIQPIRDDVNEFGNCEEAKYLLNNFNEYCQPILTSYSTSGSPGDFINETLTNLGKFYDELKKNVPDYMSLLKHRIVDLFLPLEIDLQGMSECLSKVGSGESENENNAIQYLKEVLEEKAVDGEGCSYYRKRLSDLQFMIVGSDNFEKRGSNLECNKKWTKHGGGLVKTNLSSNDLPGGYGVLQLIVDKENNMVRRLWQTLLTLCGLMVQEQVDEVMIFSQDKLISDNNAPIFGYMCLLDCKTQKIKEKKELNRSDMNEILHFRDIDIMLKKLLADYPIHIDSDISFHNWFIFLNFCLDKLWQECRK